jgi:RNA polymerase sigma-70 factor (ECF subfamily)
MSTSWAVVLAAADRSSPHCDQALATLCAGYWYPLYAFIRRQGFAAEDAEDLTQEFLARLLEKDYLEGVGPEKGKFRTFLLVCLKRFLANQHDRAHAQKRGGGRRLISIDVDDAERRYRLEPSHELTAERIFERRWALTLLQQVLLSLGTEFQRGGKQALFETLKVYLAADQKAPPYAQVADQLGLSEDAVKVAVYRLRERYRRLLRDEVARTLGDTADVDEEICALFQSLAL